MQRLSIPAIVVDQLPFNSSLPPISSLSIMRDAALESSNEHPSEPLRLLANMAQELAHDDDTMGASVSVGSPDDLHRIGERVSVGADDEFEDDFSLLGDDGLPMFDISGPITGILPEEPAPLAVAAPEYDAVCSKIADFLANPCASVELLNDIVQIVKDFFKNDQSPSLVGGKSLMMQPQLSALHQALFLEKFLMDKLSITGSHRERWQRVVQLFAVDDGFRALADHIARTRTSAFRVGFVLVDPVSSVSVLASHVVSLVCLHCLLCL